MAPRRRAPGVLEKGDLRFEGTAFSNPEIEFLLEHLGESAMEAVPDDEELPEGVNEMAVMPLLDRTKELDAYQTMLRERSGDDTIEVWAGFDKLRAILRETQEMRQEVAELKKRTRNARPEVRRVANAPSLHLWDPHTDQVYLGGVGADAEKVLTRLDSEGNRTELHTELVQTGESGIKSLTSIRNLLKGGGDLSDVGQANKLLAATPDDFRYTEDGVTTVISCPLCGKAETFDTSKPTTKRAAMSRMMNHLKTEGVTKVDQHRLLLRRIQSGRAGGKRKQAS